MLSAAPFGNVQLEPPCVVKQQVLDRLSGLPSQTLPLLHGYDNRRLDAATRHNLRTGSDAGVQQFTETCFCILDRPMFRIGHMTSHLTRISSVSGFGKVEVAASID